MLKTLYFVDMFGQKLSFNINSEQEFKTILGGIMSIISASIFTTFFILFGLDFFYKTNPNIIFQNVVPNSYSLIPINEKDFILPWRIEDAERVPVNWEGLIYPEVYLFASRTNESGY